MINFNDNTISASPGLKTDGITLSGDGTSANPIGLISNRYETFLFSGGLNSTATFSAAPLSQPASSFDMLAVCVCNQGNSQAEANYINYIPSTIMNPSDGRNCLSHLNVQLGAGGNAYWYCCYSYLDTVNNVIYARTNPAQTLSTVKRYHTEISGNYTNNSITATSAVHYNNKCIKWVKGVKFI